MITLTASLVMAGCTGENQQAELLEEIEQALEKNHELENGQFEVVNEIINPGDGGVIKSEGVFHNKENNQYDWYIKFHLSDNNDFSELAEIDGRQYMRFHLDGNLLDWEEDLEKELRLSDYVQPLFELEELDDLETIEVEEAQGMTKYIVRLKDAYSERIIQANTEAQKESIEQAKENDVPEEAIEDMEDYLKVVEQKAFSDFIYTYEVDDNGHGVKVATQYNVTHADGESYASKNTYSLIAYNVENAADLIPTIE